MEKKSKKEKQKADGADGLLPEETKMKPECSLESLLDTIEESEAKRTGTETTILGPLTAEDEAGSEDESEDKSENKDKDKAEDNAEDKDADSGEKEEESDGELAALFGAYPLTMKLLSEKKFKLTPSTATFVALIEGYARGKGLAPERTDSCLHMLFSIGAAYSTGGGFSLDMFETVMKGEDFDRSVALASDEAELRGRNLAIEEKVFLPDDAGDGIPHLRAARPSTGGDSIFSLARGAR